MTRDKRAVNFSCSSSDPSVFCVLFYSVFCRTEQNGTVLEHVFFHPRLRSKKFSAASTMETIPKTDMNSSVSKSPASV